MTATDELRRLLDERGVEWTQGMAWNVTVINGDWLVVEDVDFGTLSASTTTYQLTPEQAIAATLGRGECEQVLTDCDDGLMPPFTAYCSKCGTKWGFTPKFCHECGARVTGTRDERKAVKR